MPAFGLRIQLVDATSNNFKYEEKDVENEAEAEDLLHRRAESIDVGSLAERKELLQYLRRTRVMRRSRHHTQKTADHGRITDTVSIRQRPASVEDRAVLGHWEGDLLFGSNSSQIATWSSATPAM